MKNKFNAVFIALLFILVFVITGGLYFLYSRQESILKDLAHRSSTEIASEKTVQSIKPNDNKQGQITCGEVCEEEINNLIAKAVATLSANTTQVVQTTSGVSKKTNYISLGTIGTTTSTDWVDVKDSEVYIDAVNDYSEDAKISWEAFLKVAHGNGKAYARLYDDTNKIAVDFSEISTENNDTLQRVSSGNLPFWRGRNLYKVQIKSLNSFEIAYSGGRIKVVY